ncbi:MAG: TauD/TfdA family dioxygenase [Cocleimonas sp.]
MKQYNKSIFKLDNTDEYLQWRENKLSNAKSNQNKRLIHLKKTPPTFLPVSTNNNKEQQILFPINRILAECDSDNYCLYSLDDYANLDIEETKQLIVTLAQDCGLFRLDGNICADQDKLTSICQTIRKGQHEYIPYTNKKLSWHTDGYYNLPENTIYSMLLHCFRSAENGGESAFMDHEIAYILLRDENPKWIAALSHKHVMTIPANILNGKVIRAEQTGPVLSVTPQGRLHMRYSARQKNIVWSKDIDTLDAVSFLQRLLSPDNNCSNGKSSDKTALSKYIIKHKLKAGEGIISRNVLHCRSAFDDKESSTEEKESSIEKKETAPQQRLLFRGRYYDEIQ